MIDTNSTDDLRLMISLAVIGQQLLIALVFLKGRPLVAAQWLGTLLLLGAVAYLVQNNAVLIAAAGPFTIVFDALALAVPYLLWEFSIAIFEIRSVPRAIRFPVYLVPIAVLYCTISGETCSIQTLDFLVSMHRILGLVVIAHIVVSVYLDRRDDLLEPRRRYRALFVLLIAIQAGAVLTAESLLGYSNFPDWLELTNVIMIALLTLGLSLPLLMLESHVLWQKTTAKAPAEDLPPPDTMSPADKVLRDGLNALFQEGHYRTRDLQIHGLAASLRVPEHQLRKLINQQLGYRNFSSFLNYYRIREAEIHLSSAEKARIPVLTIAMDLGYGSIGPFNRAFKEHTGLTPTEYRRQKTSRSGTDSE